MMRPASDLLNKPIITLDEGRFLGEIKGLYFDADLTLLVALSTGRRGLLRRQEQLIPRVGIHVLGLDAILVKNSAVVSPGHELPARSQWVGFGQIRGRDVETPGGTRVGVIGDLMLDGEARVLAFNLSRIYVDGPIAQQRRVARSALLDMAGAEAALTVDLSRAEMAAEDPAA